MEVDQSINLKAGKIIQGKYEVLRCLGAGSMGMVYAVKHLELQNRILAMKVLFADVAKDEVQIARFRNEIVASYEVNHPNVVRAYDYFKEGDLTAYTMEYVSGGDLADKLNEEDLITIPVCISMLKQMASGLSAIHAAGIIHRDLKPENILISVDGSIKITDFGIARTAKGPRLTDHGGIVGTFAYVSPEYLEHGKLDYRSDIYSIGVLAYEMVVGVAPYDNGNVIESMHAKLSTDPKEPYLLRRGCSKELSDIIIKALARNPDLRYQSAEELSEALGKLDTQPVAPTVKANPRPLQEDEPRVLSAKPVRKAFDSEIGNLIEGLRDSIGLSDELGVSTGSIAEEELRPAMIKPVTVSQGRLSAEKFKALQEDLGTRRMWINKASMLDLFATFFMGFLMFSTGAVVGLVALKYTSFNSFKIVWAMIGEYLGR